MTRLFFVLNSLSEFDFGVLLEKHLPGVHADVGTQLPRNPADYRLVVLWSYRKVVAAPAGSKNIVLFHSSDLPKGRGWAPIYHALVEHEEYFVVSGIFAAAEVDAGDVIVKARFKILPNYTAADLRRFDRELSLMLLREILSRFEGRQIAGIAQSGNPTSRPRRTPEDCQIDLDRPFRDIVDHLRACEPRSPAFFESEGCRYLVSIEAADIPDFPKDIQVVFGEDGLGSF
jgi:methionyl-tRNA formyltransferase